MKKLILIVCAMLLFAVTAYGESETNIDYIRDLMTAQMHVIQDCTAGTLFQAVNDGESQAFPEGIVVTEVNGTITSVRMVVDNSIFLMNAQKTAGAGEAIAGYMLYSCLLAGIKELAPCTWWHINLPEDPYYAESESEMLSVYLRADTLKQPEASELETVDRPTKTEWLMEFFKLSGKAEIIDCYCHESETFSHEQLAITLAYVISSLWKHGMVYAVQEREEAARLPDSVLISDVEDFGARVDVLFSNEWLVMGFEIDEVNVVAGYFCELLNFTNLQDEPYLLLYVSQEDGIAYPYGEGPTPTEGDILSDFMYLLDIL